MLLLASGDMKESVYLEATKALRTLKKLDDPFKPKTADDDATKLLPSFCDMVNYIHEQVCVYLVKLASLVLNFMVFVCTKKR